MKNIIASITLTLILTFGLHANVLYTDSLQIFLDGVIHSKLKDKNIAGATLCIVNADGIISTKGYGYSDIIKQEPVDPDSTLFRIGSISKLFVWIAVMQQVQEGILDLDTDVNRYLTRIQLANNYNEPITLRHLISHTPGLDDRLIGLFSYDSTKIVNLANLLKDEMPRRVAPPGEMASYSNHGAALAAHIVEIASGLKWDDYVEERIMHPLGMHRTTFRQPLPSHLRSWMSRGYTYVDGRLQEKPFEYVPLAPAGSVSSTASDMGEFMVMLLNNGVVGDTSVVDTASLQVMLTPFIQHTPSVNPTLQGFLDLSQRNVSIYGHGGDTFWFHSLLAIVPEHNIGIFISFNSQGGEGTYGEVLELLVDNYFTDKPDSTEAISLPNEYLESLAGEYRSNRYPRSDYLKMISLVFRVIIEVDNGLLRTKYADRTNYWEPIENTTFRQINGSDILSFRLDESGTASYAFLSSLPILGWERVNFFQSTTFHFTIFSLAIAFSLIALIHWPMIFFVRRRYQAMSITKRELPFQVKFTAWLNAFLLLGFYIAFMLALGDAEGTVYDPSLTAIKFTLLIPFFVILLTLLMLFYTITIWPMHRARIRSRLFYTLLLIVNIAALWQLFSMNLIGFYL